MSKELERTPSPWILESRGWDGQFIYGQDERAGRDNRRFIADVSLMFDGAEANAAFIVRACNAHDDLVKALQSLVGCISETRGKDSYDALLSAHKALAKATT